MIVFGTMFDAVSTNKRKSDDQHICLLIDSMFFGVNVCVHTPYFCLCTPVGLCACFHVLPATMSVCRSVIHLSEISHIIPGSRPKGYGLLYPMGEEYGTTYAHDNQSLCTWWRHSDRINVKVQGSPPSHNNIYTWKQDNAKMIPSFDNWVHCTCKIHLKNYAHCFYTLLYFDIVKYRYYLHIHRTTFIGTGIMIGLSYCQSGNHEEYGLMNYTNSTKKKHNAQ